MHDQLIEMLKTVFCMRECELIWIYARKYASVCMGNVRKSLI